jgi:hypothetical protein
VVKFVGNLPHSVSNIHALRCHFEKVHVHGVRCLFVDFFTPDLLLDLKRLLFADGKLEGALVELLLEVGFHLGAPSLLTQT